MNRMETEEIVVNQNSNNINTYASLEEILDNVGCGICVIAMEGEEILFTNEKMRNFFSSGMLKEKNVMYQRKKKIPVKYI